MTLRDSDRAKLESVDPALRDLVVEVAAIVPLVVLEGHRGQEAQEKAFAEGKTKLHWPNGKHNAMPSRAVDLAPVYMDGGAAKIDWEDLIAFGRIMGAMQSLGFQQGMKLRFGLDWDGDFRSVNRDPSESFLDAPHVELL